MGLEGSQSDQLIDQSGPQMTYYDPFWTLLEVLNEGLGSPSRGPKDRRGGIPVVVVGA